MPPKPHHTLPIPWQHNLLLNGNLFRFFSSNSASLILSQGSNLEKYLEDKLSYTHMLKGNPQGRRDQSQGSPRFLIFVEKFEKILILFFFFFILFAIPSDHAPRELRDRKICSSCICVEALHFIKRLLLIGPVLSVTHGHYTGKNFDQYVYTY